MTHRFLPAISLPTREAEATVSCIDHFYIKTSIDLNNFNGFILQEKLTDHKPVILNMNILEPASTHRPQANITKYTDIALLKSQLSQETWNTVFAENDIDLAFEHFINKFTDYIKAATKTSYNTLKKKKK